MPAAFLESVSDVNSLLHGGRVPLCKDSHSMSVSYVTAGSIYFNGSQEGLSYSQFLIGMLSSKGERTVLARAMDVLEMDIPADDRQWTVLYGSVCGTDGNSCVCTGGT